MFSKVDANGKTAHLIFKYLKDALKDALGKSVKWNFTKFLIGANGNPVKRFLPTTSPEKVESNIRELLAD